MVATDDAPPLPFLLPSVGGNEITAACDGGRICSDGEVPVAAGALLRCLTDKKSVLYICDIVTTCGVAVNTLDNGRGEAGETGRFLVRYYLVSSLGTLTGETVTVLQGQHLPIPPCGFTWQPETAAILRGRAEDLRKRARSHWPQAHADAMRALAEQLEARAAAFEAPPSESSGIPS